LKDVSGLLNTDLQPVLDAIAASELGEEKKR
jgi:hypothetical protein